MHLHEEIELLRDCNAIEIPSGFLIELPKGTKVIITQRLGGSFTVATQAGLARIDAENADALGLSEEDLNLPPKISPQGSLEEAVWDQLRTVYDPEIPVNVVDLGLIYDCIVQNKESGGASVHVKMTLTAPGCGMGPTIAADAKNKILSIEGVEEAEVELVWDPPWNQSMISEEGRMKLGLI
ncbi:MAG: putative Fe-S cluster assembly protein SufT [Chthoniobacterales bacterium]|nr:putative Fe-S cluster assembly protein SufT [Chthoniobacterales bacterium]